MLYDRDFIKRLIQQLAQMLAAALKLRQAGKHEQALETIRSSSGELLGLEWDVLAFGPASSAASLLGQPERVRIYAQLLEAEAETLFEMGMPERAEASARRAASLRGLLPGA